MLTVTIAARTAFALSCRRLLAQADSAPIGTLMFSSFNTSSHTTLMFYDGHMALYLTFSSPIKTVPTWLIFCRHSSLPGTGSLQQIIYHLPGMKDVEKGGKQKGAKLDSSSLLFLCTHPAQAVWVDGEVD